MRPAHLSCRLQCQHLSILTRVPAVPPTARRVCTSQPPVEAKSSREVYALRSTEWLEGNDIFSCARGRARIPPLVFLWGSGENQREAGDLCRLRPDLRNPPDQRAH